MKVGSKVRLAKASRKADLSKGIIGKVVWIDPNGKKMSVLFQHPITNKRKVLIAAVKCFEEI